MNKVKISDLFEQEDVFKGIRKSAIDTIETLQQVQTELKESAKVIQNDIKNSSTNSAKGLKEFSSAAKAASQVMKDSATIAKQQAQAEQQKIKVDQELVKLEKLKAQEIARANKEAEKAAAVAAKVAKETANQNSAYKQLEKSTRDLKNQSKELGAQLLAMEKAGNQGTLAYAKLEKQFVEVTNEARKLDTELKDVDKSVGDNFRNVGNYEGATANLKTELRALTRELMNMSESDPKFQEMAQRAGELKDQIQDTQAVVKATAGSAVENLGGAMNSVGQIGIAAFQGIESSMVLMGVENENILASMQKLQALAGLSDALSTLGAVGDKLKEASAGFIAFGSKATAAFNGLTTAGKAFAVTGIGLIVSAIGYAVANWDKLSAAISNQTLTQKLSNQVTKEAITSIAGELSAADKLSKQLKDETLTRKQKIQKVKEFQAAYPGLLTNMNLETMSISQINSQLELNIALLKLQAKQKAIQTLREDEYKKQLIAQSGSVEDNLSWHMKLSKGLGDFIGLSKYTSGEFKKHADANIKSVTDESNTRINALDQLDKQNEIDMMNLTKKGALIKTGSKDITDYSKGVAGFTGANDQLNESLERQKQILEDLNALKKEVYEAEKAYLISLQSEQKQEEIAVAEKYDNLIERAKANEIDITLLEEAKAKELLDIQQRYADIEIQKKKEKDAQIIALEKETQDKLNAEYEKGLSDRLQAELLMADDIGKERINAENEYKNQIDKLNELNINGGIKSEAEYKKALEQIETDYTKKKAEIDKKATADETEKAKKAAEDRQKTIEAFAQKTTEYFKKKSDEKIAQIDKEIAAAEKQNETLKTLAAEGNINAQQSLAENQRIIDQANLRKEKQLRNQKRIEAGLAIFKLFSANADKKNPLAKTIADTTGLLAFISSLPMFYDGTEDTGTNGKGVDGRGGFHAVLHPNERVVPKSLNEQIGSMSNEQLAKLAQEYQNGRLVSKSNANSSLELAVLASKLDTLTDVIKNKPETNIALGEITQSAMQIVESKRTGNTTIYNRFRVSK